MSPETTNLRPELEERLRFEMLIADLSSKFVNLPPGELDREIMDAERRICEVLGLDILALWQMSDEAPDFFTITHYYSVQEGPHPPGRVKAEDLPWFLQQVLAGHIVAISSLEDLPPEAAHDREVCRQLGVKSNLTIPLSVGGHRPFGALGLNTTLAQRDWTEELVKRLQLLAQVFANALARKRADQAVRQSEARLAAGAELAGLGYYEIDYAKRTSFIDDRFREIFGVPPDRRQGLDLVQFWMEHVHPSDLQLLLDERQKLHDGRIDRISPEYRYLHPDLGERWIHHLAQIAERSAAGGAVRIFGVLRDITPQKQAEAELLRQRTELAHIARVRWTPKSGHQAGELSYGFRVRQIGSGLSLNYQGLFCPAIGCS